MVAKVTILILTHHRLALIKKCLESILKQEQNNFEIEIISLINGIDQPTLEFYESFSEKNKSDFNFTYTAIDKSLPVGEARNQIMAKASGEYICFIDDDIE